MPMNQISNFAGAANVVAERGNGSQPARDDDGPRFSDMLREQRSTQQKRDTESSDARTGSAREEADREGSATGGTCNAAASADAAPDKAVAGDGDAPPAAPDAMAILAALLDPAQVPARRTPAATAAASGADDSTAPHAVGSGGKQALASAGAVDTPLDATLPAGNAGTANPAPAPEPRSGVARNATAEPREFLASPDPAAGGRSTLSPQRRPDDPAGPDSRLASSAATADPNAVGGTSILPAFAAREAQAAQRSANIPAVNVDAPVGSRHFTEQTAQQVTWLARNGVEQAEIRVKPAELGPIAVRIEMNQNEAIISFAVTQPETRAAVQDALHKLTEMLAESGIALGQASVGGQEFAGQGDFAQPGSRNRVTFASGSRDTGATVPAPSATRPRGGTGVVDTFA